VKTLAWLASYPKSGNTWIRILLSHYLAGRAADFDINCLSIPNAADMTVFDRVGVFPPSELTLDEGDCARVSLYRCLAAQGPAPVWLKIHDAFRRIATGDWLCPPDVSLWAVYVVRHPADVAISLSYHFGMSLEEAVAFMARPTAVIGRNSRLQFGQVLHTWSDHVNSWRRQSDIPVLLVRYEDLLEDPIAGFQQVLRGLRLPVDPERVVDVVEAATFARLQRHEVTSGFSERAPWATAPFFRAGRAGQWRNQLSSTLIARLAADHRQAMDEVGYDFGGLA